MKDILADHAKDWLTTFFLGLGITFAPHEWVGGLFLAFAGAAFAMRSDPEQDVRELWLVLLGAFLASHLAALGSHAFFPDFPIQVVMAVSGFFSRRITRFALRMAGMVESRSDRIADRLIDRILPANDKNGDMK
jgi:drug/metabolite transporter (DMT)-like permease